MVVKMADEREKVEVDNKHWWLGPLGVMSVAVLIFFALLKSAVPIRLDDLPDQIGTKINRTLKGKHRAMWLGMEVSPLSRANAVEFGIKPNLRGVVITDLTEGQGANIGMNVGDVIVGVNGTKITDFESFLWLARQSKFSDGILLDVMTNGRRRFVSVPFTFNGGPLIGPKANHWQLGGPVNNPVFGYGRLVAFQNNAPMSFAQPGMQPAAMGQGGSQFMICPNCGHSSPGTGGPMICPNCNLQMMRNQ